MAEQAIRFLAADEALRLYESVSGNAWPATLHPRYVIADAARSSSLVPAFVGFESQGEHWLHSLHVTTVAGTGLRDASSPYGYGGPLATSSEPAFIRSAWDSYRDFMRESSIVVEYVRFHPLLANERWYGGNVLDNRTVVSVELGGSDPVDGYAARLKQTVKKGEKLGLRYEEHPLASVSRSFGEFHRAAMREMRSDPFYVFDRPYFEALAEVPGAIVGVCTPASGDEWFAAAVFLDGRGVREYHLAATNSSGRSAGASSFTLHQAALAAQARGIGQLYLGGGTDPKPDNPLFFFKAGFSQQRLTYRTGWTVFDAPSYEELKAAFPEQWRAHPERPIFHRKV